MEWQARFQMAGGYFGIEIDNNNQRFSRFLAHCEKKNHPEGK